jgi:hypothetical protein
MGHGCYFTHDCNKTKAAWIDISNNITPGDDSFLYDQLDSIFENIGYKVESSGSEYKNGLFKVELKQYSEHLVIYIEPRYINDNYGRADKDKCYHLAMANHAKAENKIWKALQKAGFDLYIAASGYTSQKIGKIE